MTETTITATIATLFILLFLVVGLWLVSTESWKQAAIKRGYAQYCQTSGVWAWKGECEE